MSIKATNWAHEVCVRIGVPARHRLVLFMICHRHHDRTGDCFPSYDTIAKSCGFSRRKVIDLIGDLEKNGLLIRQKRRVGGRQGSNHYVLFGRPVARKWVASSAHKKAPSQSANSNTSASVQTEAPDKDCLNMTEAEAGGFRVLNGGRASA